MNTGNYYLIDTDIDSARERLIEHLKDNTKEYTYTANGVMEIEFIAHDTEWGDDEIIFKELPEHVYYN